MIRVMGGASVIAADFVPGWLRRAKGSGRHADRLTGVAEFGAWTPPHGGNYTSTGANTEHGMGAQSFRSFYGSRIALGRLVWVGHSADGTRRHPVCRASIRRAAISMYALRESSVTPHCSYQCRRRLTSSTARSWAGARLREGHSFSALHPRSPD